MDWTRLHGHLQSLGYMIIGTQRPESRHSQVAGRAGAHSWVSSACSGDISSSSGSSVVRGLSTGTTLVMLRFSAYSCSLCRSCASSESWWGRNRAALSGDFSAPSSDRLVMERLATWCEPASCPLLLGLGSSMPARNPIGQQHILMLLAGLIAAIKHSHR